MDEIKILADRLTKKDGIVAIRKVRYSNGNIGPFVPIQIFYVMDVYMRSFSSIWDDFELFTKQNSFNDIKEFISRASILNIMDYKG